MKFKLIKPFLSLCLLATSASNAQSPYWGFEYANTLAFTPSTSFVSTALAPLMHPTATWDFGGGSNTIYDETGNLLFTITNHGVYNAAGTFIYGTGGTPDVYSEFEVFPTGKDCGHYYAIYYRGIGGSGSVNELALLEIDASNPSAIGVSKLPNLVDWVAPVTSPPSWTNDGVGIVSTPLNEKNERVVYVFLQTYEKKDPGGIIINQRDVIKRWTFFPDGTYTEILPEISIAAGDLMGDLSIMDMKPDGSAIAYPGRDGLKVFNTSSHITTTYPMPMLDDWQGGDIAGIEYVPGGPASQGKWYVSYNYQPASGAKKLGTIGYFIDGVTTTLYPAGGSAPSTSGASELELGQDGWLYFSACPNCTTPATWEYYSNSGAASIYIYNNPGDLYKFDPSAPVPSYISCGIQVRQGVHGGTYYYINNQIDGEDYTRWGSGSGVANADINDEISIPYAAPACSTGSTYGPLQVVDINAPLTLKFKNSGGLPVKLTINEEYYISWAEVDECGVPLSPVFGTSHPWTSGTGPVDLKSYVQPGVYTPTPFFSTTACHNKYYGFIIEVHNKCTDVTSTYKAFIKMQDGATECSADFMYQSYSFNPNVFEVSPVTSLTGSTYMVNWGDGSGFVPITGSHLYAAGNYTLCIKEYRDGVEFCTRCKDICVSGGASTIPDETTCDFIYRSYSNTGRVLQVIPYLMPAGVSASDYMVNWGDLTTPSAPTSSHSYTADGSYTICLSRYNLHPYALICEKCAPVCIGAGPGLGTGRTTDIEEYTNESFKGRLYPNPASGLSVLELQLDATAAVNVQVTDIAGKMIQHVFTGTMKQGMQHIDIDTRSMPAGMYIVNTKVGAQSFVQKLHVIK